MESVKILQYRRWYAYEKDVHEKMLTSLSMVPAEGRREERFQKAVDLAAHLVAARWLWLRRLGASSESRDLFPSGVALGDLRAEFEEVESAWDDYLERLDDEELEREFEYGALEGGRYRNRVEDILTQLFGHSWYHRGQIAATVRALGGEPAVTDFVFWCRVGASP
jgi:uncharacterized damage-inducible protein DinB